MVSCKKETVEPIGKTVDYTTNPNKTQVFKYYFDDGEYIAGGLDQYLASIHSSKGTFTKEQLLLMTYKVKSKELPDSIIPFSYILGTNYSTQLNKEVNFHINTDYLYNNDAHKEFTEVQFFKHHINDMVLFKFSIEEKGVYYYDPEIILTECPFVFDEDLKDVIFKTKDINSSYALCWKEKHWTDSIYFNIQDNTASNTINIIENGCKNNINKEGAIYKSNCLYLTYSEKEMYSQQVTNNEGWTIYDLYVKVDEPFQGIINSDNINIDMLIKDKYGSLTNLIMTENTQVEIIKFPDFDERGELKITGKMRIQCYQKEVNIDLKMYFYRQR